MNGFLGTFTALPNLHPALVHFPVALAFTALLLELVSLALWRRIWIERAAAVLYALAAAGAAAAWLAGRSAADGLGPLSARAEITLSSHADLALWTTLALLAAAVLRVWDSARNAESPVARRSLLRLLAFAVLLGAAGLLARTADLGGALVFRHGVAVAPEARAPGVPVPETAASEPGRTSPRDRLVRGEDGRLRWTPEPGDGSVLGTVVTVLPEGAAVSPPVSAAPGEGLPLHVDGEAFLLLPGTWGNVAVDAGLDLSGFEGSAGLAHHVTSPGQAVLFTVSTTDAPRLVRRNAGSEKTLGTGSGALDRRTLHLRTTAAGTHLKGYVDGKMVVHGHGGSGTEGSAGLFLSGTGTVRILSMTIEPVGGH